MSGATKKVTENMPLARNLGRNVLLWICASLFFIAIIWLMTKAEIDQHKAANDSIVFERVRLFTDSYAEQLQRTLTLIDKISLNLKYSWEQEGNVGDLDRKQSFGIFPDPDLFSVTIVDAGGHIVSTTAPSTSPPQLVELDFFQQQKSNCCLGLLITSPESWPETQRPMIRFSRRVDRAEGAFAGVVVVSVEPSYLTSFLNFPAAAHDAFVSARLRSGQLLAARTGDGPATLTALYRSNPIFEGGSGLVREAGDRFFDDKARVVAWRGLKNYPIVAAVGLPEVFVYQSNQAFADERRSLAAAASVLVAMLCCAGWYVSQQSLRRKQAEEEIRETYRVATDAANEGFYMLSLMMDSAGAIQDFRVEDCNHHGAELFGTTREKMLGFRLSRVRPKVNRDEIFALCEHALKAGMLEDEKRIAPPSTVKAEWLYRRIVPYGGGLAVTIRDISKEKRHAEALDALANRDNVTGLPNRHWLFNYLPGAITRAARADTHLAVMFIDLDNFKNVNDTLGHDAGDELLVQTAERIRKAVRTSDHVARLGGDEFTVVLEHLEVTNDAPRVAQKIIDALCEPFALSSGQGDINASIGVSIYPDDGLDGEALLKHADIAMYAAKTAGKGRHQLYHAQLSDSLVLRMGKEQALRRAVEEDAFEVHYQPRVDAESGEIKSMEALVRWRLPDARIAVAADFIPLAEDIGVIGKIGESVMEKVCTQLAEWQARQVPLVPVSVNVSALQLKQGNVAAFLAGCIERAGIPASLIEVELTESAVIDRNPAVLSELAALHNCGVRLLIDDFGTGHSSLAQLCRLDVDMLKVDQAFTHALSSGEEGSLVYRAIVSMAKAMRMSVVAEGVETDEQLHALQALSCDEVQGYLVSKAVGAADMTKLLLRRFLFMPMESYERRAPA